MKFRVDATLYSDGANKNSDADRILKCSRGSRFTRVLQVFHHWQLFIAYQPSWIKY